MSLQNLVSNYVSFNYWANERIVQWLQPLDEAILYQPVVSSFTSIDYTLQHILQAQNFWLQFIVGNNVSNFNWAVREGEVKSILSELVQSSLEIKNKFSAFTSDELLTPLELNMTWAKNQLSRYEYMMHVINHSTFHRGQIITMARGLDITEDVPNTDYNIFNSMKK